jgi:hypothetical protein
MASLSEIVKLEYDAEIAVVKGTGELWLSGITIAFFVIVMCGWAFLFHDHWRKDERVFALSLVIIGPFVYRAYERHKVVVKMRYEREIRTEVKLDALLGLIKIGEDEW